MQTLDCWGNELGTLSVQGLTALQELDCSGNELTALNLQGLTALQELDCSYNRLTSLNVQNCTALKELQCYSNKLSAGAFTKIFTALPQRTVPDGAEALLYTENGEEGNCTKFNAPGDLKAAFDNAKDRNWKMKKENASGNPVEI